jgi:5S rRNA maturation endonuclease (ribonuclease M5)
MLKFTEPNILRALGAIGCTSNGKRNEAGWLSVTCPWHFNGKNIDRNIGNCFAHLETGVINCFSCGLKSNVVRVYQLKNNLATYSEAEDKIRSISPFETILKPVELTPRKPKVPVSLLEGETYKLEPNKYRYTRLRGFTQEFVDKYGLIRCLSGLYEDYFIIPVVDRQKGIHLFEARKLLQHERLEELLGIKSGDINELTKIYKSKTEEDLKGKDSQLLFYLSSRKVLYPPNCEIKSTIWNVDELDFKRDVVVCEGIGSIPRLQEVFGTQVTCTFGSDVSIPQFKYLERFRNIVLLVDPDDAGSKWVGKFHKHFTQKNIFVIKDYAKDTDPDFSKKIQSSAIVSTGEYLLKLIL